jgi:phage tail tape-measure protein
MEKKFVLTEEESKRILTLHKKKIQEERENISEDTGQDIGRVAAGAGAGAATGAAVGSIVPVVGTAIGCWLVHNWWRCCG